jgi:hypothetical protein
MNILVLQYSQLFFFLWFDDVTDVTRGGGIDLLVVIPLYYDVVLKIIELLMIMGIQICPQYEEMGNGMLGGGTT